MATSEWCGPIGLGYVQKPGKSREPSIEKLAPETGEHPDNGMNVDRTLRASNRRRRKYVPPTVTESIGSIIADLTREG